MSFSSVATVEFQRARLDALGRAGADNFAGLASHRGVGDHTEHLFFIAWNFLNYRFKQNMITCMSLKFQ